MQDFLEIGQIVNTYGIKGFLKVIAFTDDITRFDRLKSVYITNKSDKRKEINIQEVKYHKNLVLLKLEGIDDINQAQLYKNYYLEIKREDAVDLEEGSYFIIDMIGIQVYTTEGRQLGAIVDIFSTGSNDVYIVRDEQGKQILIPALKSVVKSIDIQEKNMTVELIKGLE